MGQSPFTGRWGDPSFRGFLSQASMHVVRALHPMSWLPWTWLPRPCAGVVYVGVICVCRCYTRSEGSHKSDLQ